MYNQIFSNRDFNEVVFANRNKAYGAYDIRMAYGNHLKKSGFIVFGFLSLLILFSFIHFPKKVVNQVIEPTDLVKIVDVVLRPIEIPKATLPPIQPIQPAAATPVATIPTRVVENIVEVKPVPASTVATVVTNPTSTIGTPTTPNPLPSLGTSLPISIPEPPSKPIRFCEKMPQYPGGEKALLDFIGKHLKYTKPAVDEGIEGRVILNFVINENGEVEQIKIARGLGYGLDEEAIGVLRKALTWAPGMQNGKKVKVEMNLPIQFQLN